ncbi:SOS response-associated peptidase [Oricola cellulosilytica]|uniref:Abasic site processing protein n=1 Tax=Oricola cellulosilytica TaxID=1429082 RepID=A0A4R0PAK9_9HYPH|nr:SOS response-associated peptidase [Oricola cellulosilytica]TCD14271.1 SOS response-associated peptidase [Oricola cellulosilytica]
MCGRFSLLRTPEEIAAYFALEGVEAFPPRYNIAPTQPILTLAAAPPREPGSNRPDREAVLARWGFLPAWVKDPKDFPLLINARSETAAEKASFRAAMRHRRILIPASGFYEWRRDKATKQSQAYWVRPVDGGIVAFAGLGETWAGPDGSEIDTAAILTTGATGEFGAIHDRMPVVVPPEEFARWLDCRTQEPRHVADLLTAPPEDYFEAIPVSDKVNKVANATPDIQQRVEPKEFPTEKKPDRGQDGAASGGAQMKLL